MLKEVAVAVAGNQSMMFVSSTLHSVVGGEGRLVEDAEEEVEEERGEETLKEDAGETEEAVVEA